MMWTAVVLSLLCADSTVVAGGAPPVAPSCNASAAGIARTSIGAVTIMALANQSQSDCCTNCRETPICLAFVTNDALGCFLKADLQQRHTKADSTSWVVRGTMPPSPPPPPPPPTGPRKGAPIFSLARALDHPVIGNVSGRARNINNGFEGGLYTKTPDGMYHLFPTECMSDIPGVAWDIHTESHHWTSPDGIHNWTMGELAFNSSAKRDGSDRRAAIFAPMNIYNPDEGCWNLLYIGYTCHPGQSDGAIYRIVSQTPGIKGVAGPYPAENATIILDEEMGKKEPWEGGQGDDSFHAWQLDNGTWMAFYGSHGGHSPGAPPCHECEWQVGLASAPKLAGPWTRMPWLNPASYIEQPEGIENPIVTRTTNRAIEHTYIAVYDALMPDQIQGHRDVVGITQSADGVHWSPAQYVSLNASASGCGGVVRTPQGLVAEPQMCKGCYSMLYTGIDTSEHSYRNECWVLLQNAAEM